MIVLKIIGWILLGILALVILALNVRVRFLIEYSSENTSAVLKWLFLKFKLYPMKKKEPKKKKEKPKEPEQKPEEPKEEEKPKEKNNLLKTIYDAEGIDGLISILQDILGYTNTFLGHSIRGFVIDELYVDIRCTRADAASTALYYGEVCAVLFPLLGALASKCKMKKYDINVYPDYIARFSDASFITSFHFTPAYLGCVLISYAVKMAFGVLLKLIVKISGVNKKDRNSIKKNKGKSESK